MQETVYHDASGRAYAVRDGVSVWLDTPVYPQFEYVGFGPRFGARAIDLVITYVLAIVVATALGFFAGFTGNQPLIARLTDAASAATFAISLIASMAFYIAAESMHGSTPGKMVLGMRVVSEDGAACSFVQALKRSVGFLVDGLFFGLPAAATMSKSARQQRIGDTWAKTVVVKARSLQPEQRRSGALFAGALAAACLAYAVLAALSMIA